MATFEPMPSTDAIVAWLDEISIDHPNDPIVVLRVRPTEGTQVIASKLDALATGDLLRVVAENLLPGSP